MFLSTPFDIESARFLNKIVPAFKISSGDNNFFPLIDYIARTGKPIILSSGLADFGEIRRTERFIKNIWQRSNIRQELAVLHCVSSYPTALHDANLLAIRDLERLKVTVGYSDHTVGIESAVLAVSLGARIIEKHFTVSRDYSDFHDHRISADPEEFRQMVLRIKEALQILGDGKKRILESEKKMLKRVRRSVAAKKDLKKGDILTLDDITWVRPGTGLAPGEEKKVLGKTLQRPIRKGERVLVKDIGRYKKR
jgi:sialic acid synthase SpsE